MTVSIKFKRGGTFSYAGLVTLPVGTWTARAQLRRADSDAIVANLTVTLAAPVAPATAHALLLECSAENTGRWPLERLRGDVIFTDSNLIPVVIPTSTFVVDSTAQVTR